jgi:hypothetical protein
MSAPHLHGRSAGWPADEPQRSFWPLTARFAVYTGVLLASHFVLPEIVRDGDISVFREGRPIEWLQFAMLALTCCVFVTGGLRFRALAQWFLSLAAVTALACIRELDTALDRLIPYVGWQLPAALVTIGGVSIIARHPRQFTLQAGAFMCRRGFAILWAGFAAAVIFAQLVGHGAFLEALMGDDYARTYKRVIEELAELFGYVLLLVGSVESVLEAPSSQRSLARLGASCARQREEPARLHSKPEAAPANGRARRRATETPQPFKPR